MPSWLLSIVIIMSLLLPGCEETDVEMAARSAADAIRAVSLDDQDVRQMSMQVAEQLDSNNTVAPPGSPYARRLEGLIGSSSQWQGHQFNFKVYLSPQVNAFALADGSIRFYSGLMDKMNDGELLFVLGHEMGHVIEEHSKEKLRMAYAGSALRKAVASQRSVAGDVARSMLGAFAQSLINAQFSQQEEREADDYGVAFLREQGLDKETAVSALMKLAEMGSGHSFMSSHPAPESRAERLQNRNVDMTPGKEEKSGPVQTVLARIKDIIDWLLDQLGT